MPRLLVLLVLLLAAPLRAEDPKPMATININTVCSSVGYETWSQMGQDKETVEMIKKLKAERAELKRRVMEAQDDAELQRINKDVQFNVSKLQQLQQLNNGNSSRRSEPMALVREYVQANYKGKYALILDLSNRESGSSAIIVNDLKVVDITAEVIAALKAAND